MIKKPTRGGKRPNSGRKKVECKTKVITFRVRESWAETIRKLVKDKVAELMENEDKL